MAGAKAIAHEQKAAAGEKTAELGYDVGDMDIKPQNPANGHTAGHRSAPVPRPDNCGSIALVLQGGGALPPAFLMVKIGTDYFWDGGSVSNTPLQHLLAQDDDINSLVFQVDLFSARGDLPRTYEALVKVPEADLTDEQRAMREKLSDLSQATILQLIYQQNSYVGNARDYEFSADSMHEHWKNRHEDTLRTLNRTDWLKMPPGNIGVVTHGVHRENEGR
ncbi:MAG: DUF3734 domain-containing protein [Alphaproteobacteria bacterium]|nr:DUF3734 domain-containing protein [Alphaproteobacteria bacterium]